MHTHTHTKGRMLTRTRTSWCRCIHTGQERERQREDKRQHVAKLSLTPRPKETADLEFRRRRNSHKTVNTPTGRRVQDNRKGVYSGSQGRMSQNILRAPKGARHSCEVVSTDRPPSCVGLKVPIRYSGKRQVIVQTKERCTCSHYQLYIRALWAPRRRSKPRHVT